MIDWIKLIINFFLMSLGRRGTCALAGLAFRDEGGSRGTTNEPRNIALETNTSSAQESLGDEVEMEPRRTAKCTVG